MSNKKTFLITGVSSGIGYGAAEHFLKSGHTVIGTVRSISTIENLKSYENFIPLNLDLKNKSAIESIPRQLADLKISSIDILINNAGIAIAGPFVDQNFSEIEETMQVNVLALMNITQKLIPLMTKNSGRIINISSVSGQNGTPFLTAYCASKHAVEGFSEGLRRELQLFGIAVIVIGPGSIKTPIWFKGFENVKDVYSKSAFAKSFERFIKFAMNEEKNGLPVSDIVRDLDHAALNSSPCLRYAPIPRKFRNYYLARLIPKRKMDRMMAEVLGLENLNN